MPKEKAADAKIAKPQAQAQTQQVQQQPAPAAPENGTAPASKQLLELDDSIGKKMKSLPQFAQQVAPGQLVVQRTMQAANQVLAKKKQQESDEVNVEDDAMFVQTDSKIESKVKSESTEVVKSKTAETKKAEVKVDVKADKAAASSKKVE